MPILIYQRHDSNFFAGYDCLVNMAHQDGIPLPILTGLPSIQDAYSRTVIAAANMGVSCILTRKGNAYGLLSFDNHSLGWDVKMSPHTGDIDSCTFWYRVSRATPCPDGWLLLHDSLLGEILNGLEVSRS